MSSSQPPTCLVRNVVLPGKSAQKPHLEAKPPGGEDALNAAPTMERLIPLAISHYEVPGRIQLMLEDEQGLLAAMVWTQLPELERRALQDLQREKNPSEQREDIGRVEREGRHTDDG